MIDVRKTPTYDSWFDGLRDARAKAKINVRIYRLQNGNPGDVKPVGEGISELRIKYGPGYRVYYVQRGKILVILLCGGDKSTQAADIKRAKEIANELEDEDENEDEDEDTDEDEDNGN
ncbi:type II toxin-antitoxin system RelE/ParE family toxin [Pseudochelatococcus sp. B33]